MIFAPLACLMHGTSSAPHSASATGCNRWDRGLDVVVEGDATHVTDDLVLARVAGRSPPNGTGGGNGPHAMALSETPVATLRRSCSS
jgi:hypothetical protein